MTQVIKLNGGRYSLKRERDGRGDSGPMFRSIDPSTGKKKGEEGEIHMGCAIQCGTFFARSYSAQDWWLTTPVTEILEISDDGNTVKFKTGNSIYIARAF